MPVVFTVQLVDIDSKRAYDQKRINIKQLKEENNRMMLSLGNPMMKKLRDMVRYWLSPSNRKINIGYTGGASENIEIKQGTSQFGGYVQWYLVEGSKTHTNELIREGIQPGHDVDIRVLRTWAAKKVGSLVHPRDMDGTRDGKKSRVSKLLNISDYTKKSGTVVKGHGRSMKGGKATADSALYAIKNALKGDGSFRPGANWYERSPLPRHLGYFDYPKYLANRNEQIQKMAQQVSWRIGEVLWDYLRTGNISRFRRTLA